MPEVLSGVLSFLLINLALCLAVFVALWGVAVAIDDVSFIDGCWGLGLAGLGAASFVQSQMQAGAPTTVRVLMLALVVLWGVRLGGYLLWRWRGHGADRRYKEMLERAEAKGESRSRAMLNIFLVQAVILFVVGLPVQLGMWAGEGPVGALGWAGAAISLLGVVFETVGDAQMARFKANSDNRGKVMDRGLWRYTRHPNYFGDLCVWFGLWLVAAGTGWIGAASIIGPLVLLTMFLKVSGGSLYEARLAGTRPGYAEYLARTSPLVPLPPKKS